MPSYTPNTSRPETISRLPEGGLFRLLEALVAMLLVARLLVPPEAAVFGETLWITQLWFAAVVLWGWDAYRRADYRLRWGWIDVAVWVVVFGHGISTARVLAGWGEKRSALNLLWEWVGLGISFFLIRQVLRTREQSRQLIGVMLAVAVMLSAHGIWQHYVELPRLSRNFERLLQELGEAASPADAARLQRELLDMGVPPSPGGRSLWENRLRSTEPFATFALANTLGGFLAAWLFVALDGLAFEAQRPRQGSWFSWRVLGKAACLAAVGYCLVLTKSRTAWASFAAGLCAWALFRGGNSWKFSRRWLFAGAGLVLVLIAFFAVAGLSGGFDRQVISEAPKSLAYRLEYWAGSWEVVKNHLWLGTGPGNFRQHYLHYKLPESSEEIADPHNWLLGLWTSGGLLALVGFLAVLSIAVRGARLPRGESDQDASPAPVGLSAWEIGAGLAFLLVLVVRWLSGELFEGRMLWLLAVWGGAWGIVGRKGFGHLPVPGVLAGGVAILVHLLGAGGIEMPAIVQTLLLFVVFLTGAAWEPAPKTDLVDPAKKSTAAAWGFGMLAFGMCLVTASVPVWKRSLYVSSGDAALSRDFNPVAAKKAYEMAAEADPSSPEPIERLGELHFQRWLGKSSERDFEEAVRYGRRAIALDPASNLGYRRLGQWYLERAEREESAADAKIAADYLSEATARYPNSARLRAELAKALQRAGDSEAAAAEALKALDLDRINRAAGHSDKYLPDELVRTLNEIAESP